MQVIYIGGVGSDDWSTSRVAAALGKAYGCDVRGIPLHCALRFPRKVAALAAHTTVITHSAGAYALWKSGARPRRLIAVAPPSALPLSRLLWRTARSTIDLVRDGIKHKAHRRHVMAYHRYAFIEHVRRPRYNSLQVRKISTFDCSKYAAQIAHKTDVTIVAMSADRMYLHASLPQPVYSKVVQVNGHHDELVLRPEIVVRALGLDKVRD